MSFAQGMQMGMQAFQGGVDNANRRRQLDMQELEQAAEQKRRDQLGQQWEMDMALKKEEAARYVEAESAFQKFGESTQAIDWSSPNARKEYEQSMRLHLTSVLKHENTAKKWEAFHKATLQNTAYTDAKIAEMQLSDLAGAALHSGAGPDALGIQADVKAGRLTPSEGIAKIAEVMAKRDEVLHQRAKELREISHPERTEPRPMRPDYRAAVLPGETSELKRLATLREGFEAQLRGPDFKGIEPKPTTGWFGGKDDTKGEKFRAIKKKIDELDAREQAINDAIEERANRAAGGSQSSVGPKSPSTAAPSGDIVVMTNPQGQRVNVPRARVEESKAKGYKPADAGQRYKIELVEP